MPFLQYFGPSSVGCPNHTDNRCEQVEKSRIGHGQSQGCHNSHEELLAQQTAWGLSRLQPNLCLRSMEMLATTGLFVRSRVLTIHPMAHRGGRHSPSCRLLLTTTARVLLWSGTGLGNPWHQNCLLDQPVAVEDPSQGTGRSRDGASKPRQPSSTGTCWGIMDDTQPSSNPHGHSPRTALLPVPDWTWTSPGRTW